MIDVRLRMFIPSRAVAIPLGPLTSGFDGDNRSFSPDQGTSRAELSCTVDNSPGAAQPVQVTRRVFGQTARYSADKIEDVPGRPFWWKTVKRQPLLGIEMAPDDVATAEVNDASINASGIVASDTFGLTSTVKVSLHVAGTNPLEPLAFPFNLDLELDLLVSPVPAFSYSVTGVHDPFPAYELYLNGREIYRYDPVAAGGNPFELAGPESQSVNIPQTVFI